MSNAVHGKLTDFRIADSGATLRDISTYVNKVSLDRDAPEIDVTTFQDTERTFIPDFAGAKISFDGNAHATVMGYLHPILGQSTAVAFQYGPEGSATGKRKMTGNGVLISLKDDGAAAGQQNKFTAELRITNGITFGTY